VRPKLLIRRSLLLGAVGTMPIGLLVGGRGAHLSTLPAPTYSDTTVPDTTVPDTTVPDTTVPDTTVPCVDVTVHVSQPPPAVTLCP
jgi:hypothetical protein